MNQFYHDICASVFDSFSNHILSHSHVLALLQNIDGPSFKVGHGTYLTSMGEEIIARAAIDQRAMKNCDEVLKTLKKCREDLLNEITHSQDLWVPPDELSRKQLSEMKNNWRSSIGGMKTDKRSSYPGCNRASYSGYNEAFYPGYNGASYPPYCPQYYNAPYPPYCHPRHYNESHLYSKKEPISMKHFKGYNGEFKRCEINLLPRLDCNGICYLPPHIISYTQINAVNESIEKPENQKQQSCVQNERFGSQKEQVNEPNQCVDVQNDHSGASGEQSSIEDEHNEQSDNQLDARDEQFGAVGAQNVQSDVRSVQNDPSYPQNAQPVIENVLYGELDVQSAQCVIENVLYGEPDVQSAQCVIENVQNDPSGAVNVQNDQSGALNVQNDQVGTENKQLDVKNVKDKESDSQVDRIQTESSLLLKKALYEQLRYEREDTFNCEIRKRKLWSELDVDEKGKISEFEFDKMKKISEFEFDKIKK